MSVLSLFARCAAQHLVQLSALTIYGKKKSRYDVVVVVVNMEREKKGWLAFI